MAVVARKPRGSWCSRCRDYGIHNGVCLNCAPPEVQAVAGVAADARSELRTAPLSPGLVAPTHDAPLRAQRVRDLYRKLLNAAEDALDTVTSGAVQGKELQSHAYVATSFMRAAAELEGDDADGANPEQLEAEIARLQRELKKR